MKQSPYRQNSKNKECVATSKSGKGPLVEFLRRHPFTSLTLLEAVFRRKGIQVLMNRASGELRKVVIPGLGVCYAQKTEPDATLLGCHRRELTRRFVLEAMGTDTLRAGVSPGFEADGGFYCENIENLLWWRIWVDLGGCAPEALSFIVDPPERYGAQVRDLVLVSDLDRLDLLAAQIEHRWAGLSRVYLKHIESGASRTVQPGRRRAKQRWQPYSRDDVEALIDQRQSGSHHKSLLGKIGRQLSSGNWTLLADVGNNPFFSAYELAYLATDTFGGVQLGLERLRQLERLGLIESVRDAGPKYLMEGRKILTWRGLELLAEQWGTTAANMRRFHPWPQRQDGKGHGHIEYATKWAAYTHKHEALTRQFVLALLFGARCVTNAIGGADVEIVTTVGSRILCLDQAASPDAGMTSVAPDARVRVAFWRRGRVDGAMTASRTVGEWNLWIEIDRSTIPAKRLEDRMDRYARVWSSLASGRPSLVWVIDGSPYREKQILDMMRARELEGWTVILERLILPEHDPWWLVHHPASLSKRGSRVRLPYESIKGMAPWRTIWMTPDKGGYQPLLEQAVWEPLRQRQNDIRRSDKPAAGHRAA